ncbi:hypothetical protein ALT785_770050 [Alteromonas infernus]
MSFRHLIPPLVTFSNPFNSLVGSLFILTLLKIEGAFRLNKGQDEHKVPHTFNVRKFTNSST